MADGFGSVIKNFGDNTPQPYLNVTINIKANTQVIKPIEINEYIMPEISNIL